jgi:hypothetical protein
MIRTTSTRIRIAFGLVVACIAFLAGCSPAVTPPSPPTATATIIPPRATPALNLSPVFESAEFFVRALVASEAAKHTGADPFSINIDRVEVKEWPDAGLGCGQPGQVYTQGTITGWLLVVKVGTRSLEYHTDQNADKIVLCKETG